MQVRELTRRIHRYFINPRCVPTNYVFQREREALIPGWNNEIQNLDIHLFRLLKYFPCRHNRVVVQPPQGFPIVRVPVVNLALEHLGTWEFLQNKVPQLRRISTVHFNQRCALTFEADSPRCSSKNFFISGVMEMSVYGVWKVWVMRTRVFSGASSATVTYSQPPQSKRSIASRARVPAGGFFPFRAFPD